MQFTELCKTNVDYYNSHPATQTTIAVLLAVSTAVLLNKVVQLTCKSQPVNVYYQK